MAFDGHVHNQAAMRWFNNVQETIAFCRITQMGLLRLLTNRKVMGEEVLTQQQAWNNYDQLHQDPHVAFLNEPGGLEEAWRSMSPAYSWTDAYLLAFAKARDLTLVTFDQALEIAPDSRIIVLR
jgi:toxin-antitoxin system PIN domain toxin